MEYIDALREVKNSYIDIVNDNNKELCILNDKFQKDNYELDNIYEKWADLINDMRGDMINTDAALIGVAISIYFDELTGLLIAFLPISMYSLVNFIKDIKEYIKNYYGISDLEDNIKIYKLNNTIISKKKKIMEKEIDKLNIALDFLKSLDEEEKGKYLSLNKKIS